MKCITVNVCAGNEGPPRTGPSMAALHPRTEPILSTVTEPGSFLQTVVDRRASVDNVLALPPI